MKTSDFVYTALLLASIVALPVEAAPTGNDLLVACNQSLEQGFSGIEGQMCTWYVTPCDCETDQSLPRVCLPEDIDVETLARLVVNELTDDTALQDAYAARSAAVILSRHYHCPPSRIPVEPETIRP